jgi:hypothetical protein
MTPEEIQMEILTAGRDAAVARAERLEAELAITSYDRLHGLQAQVRKLREALPPLINRLESRASLADGHFLGTKDWEAIDAAHAALAEWEAQRK